MYNSMKKHLLILVTALMLLLPVSVKAAVGDNCANPILYSMTSENTLLAGTHWYSIKIADAIATLGENDLRLKLINNASTPATLTVSVYFGCDEAAFATESKTVAAGGEWTSSSRLTNTQLRRFGMAYTYVYAKVVATHEVESEPVPAEPLPAQQTNEKCLNAVNIVPGVTYNVTPNAETWFTYNFSGNDRLSAVFTPSESGAVFSKIVSLYEDCASAPTVQRVSKQNSVDRDVYPPAGQYWASLEVGSIGGTVVFTKAMAPTTLECATATMIAFGDNEQQYLNHVYFYHPELAAEAVIDLAAGQQVTAIQEGICGHTLTDVPFTHDAASNAVKFDAQPLAAGHVYYISVVGTGTFNFSAAGASCSQALPLTIDGSDIDVLKGAHWYMVDMAQALSYLGSNDLKVKFTNNTGSTLTLKATVYEECDGAVVAGPQSKSVKAGESFPNVRVTNSMMRMYDKIYIFVNASADVTVTPMPTEPAAASNPDCLQAVEIEDGKAYTLNATQASWFKYTFDGCHYITAEFQAEDPTHTAVSKHVELYSSCNEAAVVSRDFTVNSYTRKALPPAGTYYAKFETAEAGIITFHVNEDDASDCACAIRIESETTFNNPAARQAYVYVPQADGVAAFQLQAGQTIEVKKGLCGNGETMSSVAVDRVGNDATFSIEKLAAGHAYYIYITGAGEVHFGAPGASCPDAIALDVHDGIVIPMPAGDHWYSVDIDATINNIGAGNGLKFHVKNSSATSAKLTAIIYEDCNGTVFAGPETKTVAAGKTWTPNATITGSTLQRNAGKVFRIHVESTAAVDVTPEVIATQAADPDCEQAPEIQEGVVYDLPADQATWFKYTADGCHYVNAVYGAENPLHTAVTKVVELYTACNEAPAIVRTRTTNEYTRQAVPPAGVYYAKIISRGENGHISFTFGTSTEECACATTIVKGQTLTNPAARTAYVYVPAAGEDVTISLADGQTLELKEGICGAGEALNTLTASSTSGNDQIFSLPALAEGHAYYLFVTGAGDFRIGDVAAVCESAIELTIAANQPLPILKGQHWYSVNVDQTLGTLNGQDLKIKTNNATGSALHVVASLFESCADANPFLGPESRNIGVGEKTYSRRITNSMLQRYSGLDIKIFIDAAGDFTVTPLFEPAADQPNEDCLQAIEIVPGEEYTVLADKEAWFKYEFDGCTYMNGVFTAADPTLSNVSKEIILSSNCADVVYSTTTTKDSYTRTLVPPAGTYYAMLKPAADGKMVFSLHNSGADCACAAEIVAGQTYTAPAGTKVYRFAPDAALIGKVIEHADGQQIEVKEGICGETLNDIALTTIDATRYGVDFAALRAGHSYYVYV
ncbi:MAG TPA: hypothetical protein DEO38_03865, partial [Bacteroidales bacterium]|nr:hypothetical protein [Bacteroidales bacterium]